MTSIKMHPSELAYAFTYSKTEAVVGWGGAPFQADDLSAFYRDGEAKLVAAGRLVDDAKEGAKFSDDFTSIVLALADPSLVLQAERKDGAGLRRLTVHVAGEAIVAMTRTVEGLFEISRYADLTAAVAACTGFLGVAGSPIQAGARVDATHDEAVEAHRLATTGPSGPAVAFLVGLGASQQDAASLVAAMAEPAASGMLSVLYCAENVAHAAEPFSVMTTADAQTWIMFPPGTPEGPMVFEHSSVTALVARVMVGVAARMHVAA